MEMVSYSAGLSLRQPAKLCLHSGNRQMVFQQYQLALSQAEKVKSSMESEEEVLSLRQWPWRGFTFASDLGTVGYLVNRPQLGLLGWCRALPYYIFAVIQQSSGQKRQEEIVYQVTANGILPLLEAKAGAVAGEIAASKLIPWVMKKYPTGVLTKLTKPAYKTLGSLIALAALTPTLGDPLGQWLLGQYRNLRNREA